MHRLRHAVTSTVLATVFATLLLGCTSGSEPVPVPGAGDAAAAPSATATTPPADESNAADTRAAPPDDTTPATTGPVDSEPVSSEPAATAPPPPATVPPPPPATNPPVVYLRQGDEGPEIAAMQRKLSVLDYLADGSDTGVFDEATERGLRRFQSDYGLGVDGTFGPLTGRALNAAVQSVATGN